MAATPDASHFAIYVPYAWDARLQMDLSEYEVVAVNLAERRFEYPPISREGDVSTIGMTQSNSDVLLLGHKPDA